jgi:hypothetical protein
VFESAEAPHQQTRILMLLLDVLSDAEWQILQHGVKIKNKEPAISAILLKFLYIF